METLIKATGLDPQAPKDEIQTAINRHLKAGKKLTN